jgi:hypothetical protein
MSEVWVLRTTQGPPGIRNRQMPPGEVVIPMNVEQAISRLRERTEPGAHKCLWCCSVWRLSLINLAGNPALGRDVMLEEPDIAAEVRALQAAHPAANLCAEHKAKMAELEAAAVGA